MTLVMGLDGWMDGWTTIYPMENYQIHLGNMTISRKMDEYPHPSFHMEMQHLCYRVYLARTLKPWRSHKDAIQILYIHPHQNHPETVTHEPLPFTHEQFCTSVHCLWYLVSHTMFAKGLNYIVRSFKVLCLLIVNMRNFFKWKLIYIMIFGIAHWDMFMW